MEVYIGSAVALFAIVIIVLGPILGIIPDKSIRDKQEKVGRAGRYFRFFFFSLPTLYIAFDLVDNIDHRSASSIFIPFALPYVGLALFGTVMIMVAFLTLKNSAAPLRWINFAAISSGVVVSFVLLVESEKSSPKCSVESHSPG